MTVETTDAGQKPDGQPSGTPGVDAQGKVDLATLPAPVQSYIRELREESKGHRLAHEAAESKIQELTEDLEAAQTASTLMSENAEKATRALTLRNLRDKYGLDDRAERFLTGKTEEELEEQAKELSTFVTPPKNDDGKDPGGTPAGGLQRTTDPAQQGTETVDEDAARAAAFFG